MFVRLPAEQPQRNTTAKSLMAFRAPPALMPTLPDGDVRVLFMLLRPLPASIFFCSSSDRVKGHQSANLGSHILSLSSPDRVKGHQAEVWKFGIFHLVFVRHQTVTMAVSQKSRTAGSSILCASQDRKKGDQAEVWHLRVLHSVFDETVLFMLLLPPRALTLSLFVTSQREGTSGRSLTPLGLSLSIHPSPVRLEGHQAEVWHL